MVKKFIRVVEHRTKVAGVNIEPDTVIIMNNAGFILQSFTMDQAIKKLECED